MAIQVCYFKKQKTEESIKNILGKIYKTNQNNIKKLEDYDDKAIINFQFTKFGNDSDFNYQLEIFVSNDLIISLGIFNNLILAIHLNKILEEEILINDESDDPYQWLLIKNNKLYLVEEYEDLQQGINLLYEKSIELNILKAINLLQNKDYYINNKAFDPYYIKNAKKWLTITL